MVKKGKARKLLGRTFFISEGEHIECNVKEAILRGESNLVIEFVEEDWNYVVQLERIGNSPYFKGCYNCRKINSNELDQGNVDITLYENKEGYLLYGKWIELDSEFFWFVEFVIFCYPSIIPPILKEYDFVFFYLTTLILP